MSQETADPALAIAREQLARMRGMTAMYHRRFFADVRLALVGFLALFSVAAVADEPALALLVPYLALWGAVQTAFDASYLQFARRYAAALERWINERIGEMVLLGADMEERYLFPLDGPKVVTVPLRGPFSYFSFVTLFTTVGGLAAATAGLVVGAPAMEEWSQVAGTAYWVLLSMLTVSAVGAGIWWFVLGVGDRRLREALSPFDG